MHTKYLIYKKRMIYRHTKDSTPIFLGLGFVNPVNNHIMYQKLDKASEKTMYTVYAGHRDMEEIFVRCE